MITSPELMSPYLLRHHGADRTSGSLEPKSRRGTAQRKPARKLPPIVAVTGTNGKTTIARMVAHVAEYMGVAAGMTSDDAAGDPCIAHGDTTGARSVQTVLADPRVALAVLEISSSEVVRRGLGYDEADVAVIVDASSDDLDRAAIERTGDFRRVQLLVAERVHEGGTLLVNADDPHLRAVLEYLLAHKGQRRVGYVSMDPSSPTIKAHRKAGGLAYFPRDGWIIEAQGDSEARVVRITDLPVTLGGTARFQIMNALAAVAAARAADFGLAEIACALKTFKSSDHNLGRGDLYRVGDGYVLLDRAHTPASVEALCDTVGQWPARRITGVLSASGRPTCAILERSEEIAARSFDRVFLKEDEEEAIGRAIAEMVRDEVVVIVTDSPTRVKAILERYAALPARAFARQGCMAMLFAA